MIYYNDLEDYELWNLDYQIWIHFWTNGHVPMPEIPEQYRELADHTIIPRYSLKKSLSNWDEGVDVVFTEPSNFIPGTPDTIRNPDGTELGSDMISDFAEKQGKICTERNNDSAKYYVIGINVSYEDYYYYVRDIVTGERSFKSVLAHFDIVT